MRHKPLTNLMLHLALLGLGGFIPLGCDEQATPIERALRYLSRNQVDGSADAKCEWGIDYPGNWPQVFYVDRVPDIRVRDVSPFMVTFIHHALTHVVPENGEALGLEDADLLAAQTMRGRAIEFMRGFEAPAERPEAGTFGFWPYDQRADAEETLLAELVLQAVQGPILRGSYAPLNLGFYPKALGTPCDADDTAAVYAALLDDQLIDGGPGTGAPIEQFFEDWRDTGAVLRRLNPDWLPPVSGAFLTWLDYRQPGDTPARNDVDLAVNATVLYALGRYGQLDTRGVTEAIALISSVTDQGLHRTAPETLSNYYPDNFAFYYLVSRAYAEGGVLDLAPAVEALADDLEQTALISGPGLAYWDRGAPHLNTAFAVLTLLNADRDTPFIDHGINYLLSKQNPVTGGWSEGPFFMARADSGIQVIWVSSSFTTAMALEALCRYELAQTDTGP